MMQRITNWFAGLTGRERVLVTLAGAILAVIILAYGIILPVGRAHDAATERHRLALDNAGRVQAGLAALKSAGAAKAGGGGGSLHLIIASEADALGFDLPSNQPRTVSARRTGRSNSTEKGTGPRCGADSRSTIDGEWSAEVTATAYGVASDGAAAGPGDTRPKPGAASDIAGKPLRRTPEIPAG